MSCCRSDVYHRPWAKADEPCSLSYYHYPLISDASTPPPPPPTPAGRQTFANKTLGIMSWVMPLFVAFSAFGGLSVHIMTSSR